MREIKVEHRVLMCSGGKDSIAMLFKCLENKKKYPIDEVIFCDTGFEFPEMYRYLHKVAERLQVHGLALTYVGEGQKTWDTWAEGVFTRGKSKGVVRGFPPVLGMSWCTRELKVVPVDKYLKKYKNVKKYIGIASDEQKRIKEDPQIIYPLNELGMTEQDCITYTKKIGLYNPLYEQFGRLGCYCCPKQGKKALHKLWEYYPVEWENIKDMEKKYTELNALFPLFKMEGINYYEALFKTKKGKEK